MKVISKEDLMIVIPLISDRVEFDQKDLIKILNRFGSDQFVQDGYLTTINNNPEMEQLRKEHESKQTSFWDDAMAIMNDMTNAQVEEAIKYLESRRGRKAVSNACEAMCWED